MGDMLSGLESFGLKNMGDMNIFDDQEKKEDKPQEAAQPSKEDEARKALEEEKSCILEKSCKCRICDYQFKVKAVKTGKARLVSQDIDLRPRYKEIDTIKYGIISCPICGYSALAKNFDILTSGQAALIREKISANFTGLPEAGEVYTYDDAISRHKLALVNAVVKHGKLSERAYLCLLLAWLTRGKRETLDVAAPDYPKTCEALIEEEQDFLVKAREGFMEAYVKENFPLFVLDEQTSTYLIAALSYEVGHYDETLQWAGKIILSKNAPDRIKDKARQLKEAVESKEGR